MERLKLMDGSGSSALRGRVAGPSTCTLYLWSLVTPRLSGALIGCLAYCRQWNIEAIVGVVYLSI